jgi:RNA polymerase subunit RPABC4/transcription elongation factor Spt4
MPAPPEPVYDKATPEELLRRLDIVRDRYLLGMMTATEFNGVLKEFQFTDERGVIWTPGATTSQWYCWDREQWVQAAPPAILNLPSLPAMFIPVEPPAAVPDVWPQEIKPPPVVAASTKICVHCGQPIRGKAFCPHCGTKQAADRPVAERRCPKCHALVPADKKFCTSDGTRVP